MIDREKVIKGLECCISGNPAICKRVGCPYAEEHDGIGDVCIDHLMADALALLKAQEPVEPYMDSEGTYYCGTCMETVVGYKNVNTNEDIRLKNYCSECDRKVKWDG